METQCCSLAIVLCIGERCNWRVGSRKSTDLLHGMQGFAEVSGEVSSHSQDCPSAHCNPLARKTDRGCTDVMLLVIVELNEPPHRLECESPSHSST